MLLLIFKVFANELYNDNEASLVVKEFTKGEFKIVYSYGNERLENNWFSCKIEFNFYDHFGLDKNDIEKKIRLYCRIQSLVLSATC